jgi:hypothetical protein
VCKNQYRDSGFYNYIDMSNSIAAAKRRRAGIIEQPPPAPPSSSSSSTQQQIPARLTFQQVISMLDARLIKLESNTNTTQSTAMVNSDENNDTSVSISEYISEMDGKFNMLVEEITNLKDIVMKLQSYTMDVNKMLTEERIHIMSEFTLSGSDSMKALETVPGPDLKILTQNIKIEVQELDENEKEALVSV